MKQKGAIAAANPHTAEAGYEILKAGGNAFDAAIAACLASFVAESSLTSAGGGGFLLAETSRGSRTLFDFFAQTPAQRPHPGRVEFYPIELDFGGNRQEFHIGLGAAAVPGNLAGMFHVHKRLGSLPFTEVATPAIELARKGATVAPFTHRMLRLLGPILAHEPAGKKIFMPNGQYPEPGQTYRMPSFADFLDYLARENSPREFYEGEVAARLVEDSQNRGGVITAEDLAGYQVMERTPLSFRYREYEVLTNPPPSAGGSLVAFALSLLANVPQGQIRPGSEQHLLLLREAFRLTGQARARYLDPNLYHSEAGVRFLEQAYLEPFRPHFQRLASLLGNTTHITVADSDYNIASVTTSFGAGNAYVIPGTDITINNMLGEEDLNPHGFQEWATNQRITSMMCPTMVFRDGRPVLALGSGGSSRIRSAITQVMMNHLDFGMDIASAIEQPRVHFEKERLDVEAGFDPEIADRLHRLAHRLKAGDSEVNVWDQRSMYFGGVMAVSIGPDGSFQAGADERRGGVAMML